MAEVENRIEERLFNEDPERWAACLFSSTIVEVMLKKPYMLPIVPIPGDNEKTLVFSTSFNAVSGAVTEVNFLLLSRQDGEQLVLRGPFRPYRRDSYFNFMDDFNKSLSATLDRMVELPPCPENSVIYFGGRVDSGQLAGRHFVMCDFAWFPMTTLPSVCDRWVRGPFAPPLLPPGALLDHDEVLRLHSEFLADQAAGNLRTFSEDANESLSDGQGGAEVESDLAAFSDLAPGHFLLFLSVVCVSGLLLRQPPAVLWLGGCLARWARLLAGALACSLAGWLGFVALSFCFFSLSLTSFLLPAACSLRLLSCVRTYRRDCVEHIVAVDVESEGGFCAAWFGLRHIGERSSREDGLFRVVFLRFPAGVEGQSPLCGWMCSCCESSCPATEVLSMTATSSCEQSVLLLRYRLPCEHAAATAHHFFSVDIYAAGQGVCALRSWLALVWCCVGFLSVCVLCVCLCFLSRVCMPIPVSVHCTGLIRLVFMCRHEPGACARFC